jgi:hypothetical protein
VVSLPHIIDTGNNTQPETNFHMFSSTFMTSNLHISLFCISWIYLKWHPIPRLLQANMQFLVKTTPLCNPSTTFSLIIISQLKVPLEDMYCCYEQFLCMAYNIFTTRPRCATPLTLHKKMYSINNKSFVDMRTRRDDSWFAGERKPIKSLFKHFVHL